MCEFASRSGARDARTARRIGSSISGALRVASTLPALLAGGGIDTRVNPVALHHYLSWHSVVPAPRTILRGVTKLPPATMLTVEPDGRRSERMYWNPSTIRSSGWTT